MTTTKTPRNKGRTPANKGQTYPAEALEREDVDAILKVCSRRAPTGIRNRSFILVLYSRSANLTRRLRLWICRLANCHTKPTHTRRKTQNTKIIRNRVHLA